MGYAFKDLGSDILLVEGFLEPALCTHLIQVAECCQFQPLKLPIHVLDDPEYRAGEILPLGGNESSLQESTNQILLKRLDRIEELLLKRYGVRFAHAEMCSILRYFPGQRYKRHVDNLLLESRYVEVANGVPTRDVSIVGYLNEDVEGGETLFDRQNLKVKPSLGSVLVFPAYYTHPYQTLPVVRGRLYCFTSWLFH